jgi:8-oxo-dGTP diphosphatase
VNTRQQRRSARAILLSPATEVFLISFLVRRSSGPFAFWATPGGEVEEGEADLLAAQRELREELDLVTDLVGPVHTLTTEFEHNGAMVVSTDVFFVASCARDGPRLRLFTDEERATIQAARWWTLHEIETTSERVFPEGLTSVIRRLRPA